MISQGQGENESVAETLAKAFALVIDATSSEGTFFLDGRAFHTSERIRAAFGLTAEATITGTVDAMPKSINDWPDNWLNWRLSRDINSMRASLRRETHWVLTGKTEDLSPARDWSTILLRRNSLPHLDLHASDCAILLPDGTILIAESAVSKLAQLPLDSRYRTTMAGDAKTIHQEIFAVSVVAVVPLGSYEQAKQSLKDAGFQEQQVLDKFQYLTSDCLEIDPATFPFDVRINIHFKGISERLHGVIPWQALPEGFGEVHPQHPDGWRIVSSARVINTRMKVQDVVRMLERLLLDSLEVTLTHDENILPSGGIFNGDLSKLFDL